MESMYIFFWWKQIGSFMFGYEDFTYQWLITYLFVIKKDELEFWTLNKEDTMIMLLKFQLNKNNNDNALPVIACSQVDNSE